MSPARRAAAGAGLAATLAVIALAGAGPAATAADARGEPASGRAVMEEVDRRRRTEAEYAEGRVTVEEKGRVRLKEWRTWRSGWGASSRTLLQFLEPPEVRGVGLLTISRPGAPDEQWFYTPAIDRDRRIARQEKSTRFLGTHFTFEDMEERDLDDYEFDLLGVATRAGEECYRVEARPRPSKESQYSRIVFWVRRDAFVTVFVEGHADDGRRRTFSASEFREVEGILTAHRIEVADSRREGRTVLEQSEVRYGRTGAGPVEPRFLTLQGMRTIHPPPQ